MNPDRLPELPSDLKPIEADLAALVPASGTLNRDELMYRAGWAACEASGDSPSALTPSNRRSGVAWLWPLTTAGLVLLSATLGIVLATREPDVEVVFVEKTTRESSETEKERAPAAASQLPTTDDRVASAQEWLPQAPLLDRPQTRFGNDYLSLRERVLAFGVDVLPSYSAAPATNGSPAIGDSRYGALIGQLRGG
ncbi:MAG: hypothetical protein WD894_09020 [Pirellulales bacterium]